MKQRKVLCIDQDLVNLAHKWLRSHHMFGLTLRKKFAFFVACMFTCHSAKLCCTFATEADLKVKIKKIGVPFPKRKQKATLPRRAQYVRRA